METKHEPREYICGEAWDRRKEMKKDFSEYGYVIVRGLLDADEVRMLRQAIEDDPDCSCSSYRRDDGEGREACSVLWNEASDDITGAVCRAEKVAGTMENVIISVDMTRYTLTGPVWRQLLGGEVYPYHIKVSMKEAYSGGAFVWHQDYGYWYEDGCLFPNMGTVYIALDRATTENGCLKILVGSHRAGRIDHEAQGSQAGAKKERVELLSRELPLLHAEMSEGDGIFFHCNMLHRSDQNSSPHRRWGFLIAYNRAYNNPAYSDCHFSASYKKMLKLPNSAIRQAGTKLKQKDYVDLKGKKTAVTKLLEKVES